MVLAPIEEKKDDPLEEAEDHSLISGEDQNQDQIKPYDNSNSPMADEESKVHESDMPFDNTSWKYYKPVYYNCP